MNLVSTDYLVKLDGLDINHPDAVDLNKMVKDCNELRSEFIKISNIFLTVQGIIDMDLSAVNTAVADFSATGDKIFPNLITFVNAAIRNHPVEYKCINKAVDSAYDLFSKANVPDITDHARVKSTCINIVRARSAIHDSDARRAANDADNAAKALSAIQLTVKNSIDCTAITIATVAACASFAKSITHTTYKTHESIVKAITNADYNTNHVLGKVMRAVEVTDGIVQDAHKATCNAFHISVQADFSNQSVSLFKEKKIQYNKAIDIFRDCLCEYDRELNLYKDKVIADSINSRLAIIIHRNNITNAMIAASLGAISSTFITAADASTADRSINTALIKAADTADSIASSLIKTAQTTSEFADSDLAATTDFIMTATANDADTAARDVSDYEIKRAIARLYTTSSDFREIIESLREHALTVKERILDITTVADTAATAARRAAIAARAAIKADNAGAGAGAGAGISNTMD